MRELTDTNGERTNKNSGITCYNLQHDITSDLHKQLKKDQYTPVFFKHINNMEDTEKFNNNFQQMLNA
jgi:hypothetical protein